LIKNCSKYNDWQIAIYKKFNYKCNKCGSKENICAHHKKEFNKIKKAAEYAMSNGLIVNAGHGLSYANVKRIANIRGINELNIGHSIVSKAVFTGLHKAVKDMKELIKK
jgi:pyridoxine 5'-phosphate synthase PdxJ